MEPKTLINAGLSKKEAKVLGYFFEEDNALSREIEHKLRMRQPEVCLALIHFVKKGWLTYSTMMPEGKGRPQHLYTIKDKKEILTELINNLRKKQKKIEETISKLETQP